MSGIVGDSGRLVVHTKGDLVRERIEAAIMNGTLEPGERVVVDQVAKELGVSKIPVREALSKLESFGLIVQSPHTGPRVAPLSVRELKGVYLLRHEVEALATRLAAQTINEAAVAGLTETNETMREALRTGDISELSELNQSFHLSIARASTYDTILDTVHDCLRRVHRYRAVLARMATDWHAAVVEHDAIIYALARSDAAKAEQAMRDHVGSQLRIEIAAELERSVEAHSIDT